MLLYSKHYNSFDINEACNKLKHLINNNTTILCIGSDKILIDCLGPLVGTMLNNSLPNKIIGNLNSPILSKDIYKLSSINNAIVIDCKLTNDIKTNNIISIYDEPAFPGGFSQNKIPIGNCKIIANIQYLGNNIFNGTSLSHIYSMATIITNLIYKTINENISKGDLNDIFNQ